MFSDCGKVWVLVKGRVFWGVRGLCFFVVEFCLGVEGMAIWKPMVKSRWLTAAGSMAKGDGIGDLGVWGIGFLKGN